MRSRSRFFALATAIALTAAVSACGDDDPGATASFASPAPGTTVAGGLDFELIADGITIEEAGEVHDDAGHFHVLADVDCTATGDAIAKDADHVHLGKGQSDGTIYLEPGSHELCVQVGDGEHHALDVSDTVQVDVGIDDIDDWCGVIGEIDDMFAVTDNSDDDFATKQAAYENIRRLFTQVRAGLDLVPADERDALATTFDRAVDFITVFISAADEADAEEKLAPLWERGIEAEDGAEAYIDQTCDVAIDG